MKENSEPAVTTDRYRHAFLFTLLAFFAVSGIAAWFWWQSPLNPFTARQGQSVVASGSPSEATEPTVNADNSAVPPPETPLVPIQLSPQRLQSIGVEIGKVESR